MTLSEARRIALAAQGFDRPRPARVNSAVLAAAIRRLGLLQIDYVNVLAPAQYQVLFSRLGPYDRGKLDTLIYRSRQFTEQWAHEASIVPMELWPLLAYRRETHRARPWGFDDFLATHASYVRQVLGEIRDRGPLAAEDLHHPEGVNRRLDQAWVGTVPRAVLEAHFGRGVLAVAERRPNFVRAFDLAERLIPDEHRLTKAQTEDAHRELLRIAARACGVATAADLADYFRMPMKMAQPRIADLAEAGEVSPVRVEGWKQQAYLARGARLPRRIDAAALLAPFDPVVWFRPRTARLFGFDYRFEIFLPREKRRWGCYVLPFLLGERLVARVDLKADRENKVLRVLALHHESHANRAEVKEALKKELETMARWLGLIRVDRCSSVAKHS